MTLRNQTKSYVLHSRISGEENLDTVTGIVRHIINTDIGNWQGQVD